MQCLRRRDCDLPVGRGRPPRRQGPADEACAAGAWRGRLAARRWPQPGRSRSECCRRRRKSWHWWSSRPAFLSRHGPGPRRLRNGPIPVGERTMPFQTYIKTLPGHIQNSTKQSKTGETAYGSDSEGSTASTVEEPTEEQVRKRI